MLASAQKPREFNAFGRTGKDHRVIADDAAASQRGEADRPSASAARDGASVGVGMGQVNRVDSCHLAVSRAGAERARGAVAASDAFFPFADGLITAAEAGVTAVIQPGGSMRDDDVIKAADERGLAMVFTSVRHFRH